MNIIVQPYGNSLFYCRPDTTLERENKDFYCPESINEISWVPVVFARISKAGKCIGEKFASRYYDSFNFGVLLYCRFDGQKDENSLAFQSCADHSSLLPSPLYNPVVMEGVNNEFKVSVSDDSRFSYRCDAGLGKLIEKAVVKASETISLRIGDFVAVELAPSSILCTRNEGNCYIKADFCDNTLFDMEVKF